MKNEANRDRKGWRSSVRPLPDPDGPFPDLGGCFRVKLPRGPVISCKLSLRALWLLLRTLWAPDSGIPWHLGPVLCLTPIQPLVQEPHKFGRAWFGLSCLQPRLRPHRRSAPPGVKLPAWGATHQRFIFLGPHSVPATEACLSVQMSHRGSVGQRLSAEAA